MFGLSSISNLNREAIKAAQPSTAKTSKPVRSTAGPKGGAK